MPGQAITFEDQLRRGDRFAFGKNWRNFLKVLDPERIVEAERSLTELFGADLSGLRFLDAGCGSGLLSLAAIRLGATVTSFDLDPEAVLCAELLRDQYAGEGKGRWTIVRGSVLDRAFVESLGDWNIVYSFGVLHHTGAMWTSINILSSAVTRGGQYFLAIYNDRGAESEYWLRVKRRYNSLPHALRLPYLILAWAPHEWADFRHHVRSGGLATYLALWRSYKKSRGMSRWHDIVDWIGGYPYEWASREAIRAYLEDLGFGLERCIPNDGTGCNQYLFRRTGLPSTGG